MKPVEPAQTGAPVTSVQVVVQVPAEPESVPALLSVVAASAPAESLVPASLRRTSEALMPSSSVVAHAPLAIASAPMTNAAQRPKLLFSEINVALLCRQTLSCVAPSANGLNPVTGCFSGVLAVESSRAPVVNGEVCAATRASVPSHRPSP